MMLRSPRSARTRRKSVLSSVKSIDGPRLRTGLFPSFPVSPSFGVSVKFFTQSRHLYLSLYVQS